MSSLALLTSVMDNELLILASFSYEELAVEVMRSFAEKKVCCLWCQTANTPLWRSGPYTKKVLCNACGVKFSRVQKGHPKLSLDGVIDLAKGRLEAMADGIEDGNEEKRKANHLT